MWSVVDWANVWASVCYLLWAWRNNEHDPTFVRTMNATQLVRKYVEEYVTSHHVIYPFDAHPKQYHDINWITPKEGWVRLNINGAAKNNFTIAACAWVLRDSHGMWLGGFNKFLGASNAYIYELWGALERLTLAHRHGHRQIEIQFDSQVLVRCLAGDLPGSTEGRSL